jgi:hypothetical protein
LEDVEMKKIFVMLVLVLCLTGAMALAESIAITNYGFEQPADGKHNMWDAGTNGKGTFTDVPGWTSDTPAADSGVASEWTGSSEGTYCGYLMSSDPSTYNLTDHLIAGGEVFKLQVDVQDNWQPGGMTELFKLSLYYGDDIAGARTIIGTEVVSPVWGWTTYTLEAAATADAVGHKIGIELDNVSTPTTSDSWQGMDNVRLDTIPEPATLSLLGLGVLAMLRKRK